MEQQSAPAVRARVAVVPAPPGRNRPKQQRSAQRQRPFGRPCRGAPVGERRNSCPIKVIGGFVRYFRTRNEASQALRNIRFEPTRQWILCLLPEGGISVRYRYDA